MKRRTHLFSAAVFAARVSQKAMLAGAAGAMLFGLSSAAHAQAAAAGPYPNKTINLVVGYPPGGSTDLTARIVAPELAKRLGGNVVIENLGGAAGALGAAKVAGAVADGHTLLLGTSNEMIITGLINSKQKYHGGKDFTGIGLVASQPNVLVTTPKTGVKNTEEFLNLVRKNPGRMSFGSSGVGSALHMTGEMVKREAGVFMLHIPYRGVAPLTNDLLGGNIEFAVFTLSSALPHIRTGKMIALGVSTPTRSLVAPEIPSLSEHPKLKNVNVTGWFGLFAPAGLSAPLTERLRTALTETLQTPEVRKKLEESGATVLAKIGDQTEFMRVEAERYGAIVKFAKAAE